MTQSDETPAEARQDEDRDWQVAASFEVDGDRLIARGRQGLPAICFKCGTKRRLVSRNLTFNWEAPQPRVAILLGRMGRMMRQRKQELVLPLCKDCNRMWGLARLAMGVCVALVVAAVIVAPIAYIVGLWLLVLVLVGYSAMIAFVVWITKTKTCKIVGVNAVSTVIRGFHPKALARVGSRAAATDAAATRSRKGVPIAIIVDDANEGDMLAATAQGPQTVTRFRTLSSVVPHLWKFVAAFVAACVLLGTFPGPIVLRLFFLAGLSMVTAPILMFFPTRVEVGSDGVLISWMRIRRFVRSTNIASVQMYPGLIQGAKIMLANGKTVKVPVSLRGPEDSCATQETWSLIERIKEAVNARQGRGADPEGVALLARHDLPIAEWRRALRALGAGATATWRTAAVDADRLWNVLENPIAEPRDRAAAAIALSASEEHGSRERVRVAARAIVQPKLRVAVEAASKDDETALHEALASLADERQ